ncbi:hypothetical protein ACFX12_044324 [Malus domestica]
MEATKMKSSIALLLILVVSAFLLGMAVGGPELGTVVGIDLGTSNSRAGVYKNGTVVIMKNDHGNRMTPSWVAFTDTERLIGEDAQNQASSNPERTIFNVKRLIGRRFNDPEVQREIKFLPYKVVNKDEKPYIQVQVRNKTKVFSPENISAMILRKMKETAEAYLGKEITHAVVTVPAFFNDAQRQATKEAGTIAGLNVVRIVNEPSAAAIAYAVKTDQDRSIMVNDIGGGTFLVSILSSNNGVFEVKGTIGEWKDFDHRMLEYFIKLIKRKYNKDISKHDNVLVKLRTECDRARRALSTQKQVPVKIESLLDNILFLDTTPLSLGYEARVGVIEKLILRNTPIPTRTSIFVTTHKDNQTAVSIKVYAGERILAKDCLQVGRFNVFGIAHAPRKVPKIEVIIEVDAKGILHVKAEDNATSKFQTQWITNDKERLGMDDVQRMLKEAEEFAEADARVSERLEAVEELHVSLDERRSKITGKLADEIGSYFAKKTGSTLEEGLQWLSDTRNMEKDDFDAKLKRFEAVWNDFSFQLDSGWPLSPRRQLESIAHSIRRSMAGKIMDEIPSHYKVKMEKTLKKSLQWLEDNPNADKDDILKKLQQVRAVWHRIKLAVIDMAEEHREQQDEL